MALKTHKKIDMACQQLDTAIELFFRGENHFSVITLAGAAEEILGRFCELIGRDSALNQMVDGASKIHKKLYGEELKPKDLKFRANMARNSIKHLDSDEDLEITFDSREEMVDMLVRATDNYYCLEIPTSEQVERFNEWYMENVVKA